MLAAKIRVSRGKEYLAVRKIAVNIIIIFIHMKGVTLQNSLREIAVKIETSGIHYVHILQSI